MSMNPTVRERA
jgi:hypothetical protein